ncbi:MAG TPA: S41 family peptidase [Mucilaginibacter sp.]|nr:S41 family peptidase [Mucilaginibacter sp.]
MKKIFILISCLAAMKGFSQTCTKQQYKEDFNLFWQTLDDNYCYFQKKHIDWASLKPGYDAQVDTVTCRAGFVSVLERAIYELYDHHCDLHTNNPQSRRLVPTGADIWAEYRNGKPVIVETRKDFGAEKAGIKTGMEVVAINDVPVDRAISPLLPHTINSDSKSFALRLALNGDHISERKITLKSGNVTKDFYPDREGMMLERITYPAYVETRVMGNIGYVKVNNYLFDNAMIAKFDSALNRLMHTRALIIDLRETPSGGNTAVARAILGRFISKGHFYQKHELYAEEKATGIKRTWEEIVSPRGTTYTNPVVVLADHWTGSVSEGITIAFDGMKRATVIGTQMARLNGAVDGFEMPNTKIGFNIATERLYHIDGTPREFYNPAITVDVHDQKPGNDVILHTAIDYLNRTIK